jgi:hypothetical protein
MLARNQSINNNPRQNRPMKPFIFAFSMAAFALTASADSIVFNTLGPGSTYNQNSAFNIGQTNGFGGGHEGAAQFTALTSGNLTTVDLGLTFDSKFQDGTDSSGPVNVFLYGNAMGLPDNADQIFLGSGTPTAELGFTNNSLVSFTVAGTVPVTVGSTYWLVVKPGNATEALAWNLSSPAVPGNQDFSTDDARWLNNGTVLAAFRLSATAAVPDSGMTAVLMLIAVTTLLGLRHRMERTEVRFG